MIVDPISTSALSPSILGNDTSTQLTRGAASAAGTGGVDFGTMLADMAASASNALKTAEATSIAGVQGQATVQQVVEAVMSAEQTLQSSIAIRDKVVAAYSELSHMQI